MYNLAILVMRCMPPLHHTRPRCWASKLTSWPICWGWQVLRRDHIPASHQLLFILLCQIYIIAVHLVINKVIFSYYCWLKIGQNKFLQCKTDSFCARALQLRKQQSLAVCNNCCASTNMELLMWRWCYPEF